MATLSTHNVSLSVPRESVKQIKVALEQAARLDRQRKIQPLTTPTNQHAIPTTFPDEASARAWLRALVPSSDAIVIQTELSDHATSKPDSGARSATCSSLRSITHQWLTSLTSPALTPGRMAKLIQHTPARYSIYPPMLLLPPTAFADPAWHEVLEAVSGEQRTALWTALACAFAVTHVAINAPIPLLRSPADASSASVQPLTADKSSSAAEEANILRSPTALQPLLGDFGPPSTAAATTAPPSEADFGAALWVSARQNGIVQTWAPRHTMFSRGNIREKTRLLQLASVQRAVSAHGGQCTAVDMYAGIGYFAFSYACAGVGAVLGFEMNAWSVEGLRRGALANGWSVQVVRAGDAQIAAASDTPSIGDACTAETGTPHIQVYHMDNSHALSIVRALRQTLPPIRHVNLGLLPSSRASWATAVNLIDSMLGGWVHVHENFGIEEIDARADDVRREFQALYDARFGNQRHEGTADEVTSECARGIVVLEHVERVKTYAPGVMHCVVDIFLPGHELQS